MICLKGIRKEYNTRSGTIRAVDGVNLEVKEGEIFGIIGHSGAGKSTLLRTMNLLETPTEGEVIIGDEALTALSGSRLRKARQDIGMIFQQFNLLWSRTVWENVRFPLEIAGVNRKDADNKVKRVLELVGLLDRAESYPSQLSGGEKQRVGIARALAIDPKVLLSDEATSSLDPKTTDDILNLLKKINHDLKLTIVLITHEMHVIRKVCHRVAVMEKGKIVEMGPVDDVFSNPKQDITKRFVREELEELGQVAEPVDAVAAAIPGPVIKCTFQGVREHEPFMSQFVRETGTDIHLLQGQLRQMRGGTYGTLFIQVSGDEAERERAIEWLKRVGVTVEVVESAVPS